MLLNLFLAFFLIDSVKIKNKLIINRIPFGQVEQYVAKSQFEFDFPTFEKKRIKGRLATIDLPGPDFLPFHLERRTRYPFFNKPPYHQLTRATEKNPHMSLYHPFRSMEWVVDFKDLDSWLGFVQDQLAGFSDTTVLDHDTLEFATPESIRRKDGFPIYVLEATAYTWFDPRKTYGKDVVMDFERLVFGLSRIPRARMDTVNLDINKGFDAEFDRFLASYPDGGPYFQSLCYLIQEKYSWPGHVRIFSLFARQRQFADPGLASFLSFRFRKALDYSLKKRPKEENEAVLKQIWTSFPQEGNNPFKFIFQEECRKKGIVFN